MPAAIAQEDDDTSLGEDLAGGIITDIFDGSIDEGVNDDAETGRDAPNAETVNPNQEDSNDVQLGDDTNTQIAVPIIDQDQGAANLGANLAANLAANLDLDIKEVEEEEVPPECPPGFTLNNNGQCEQTVTEDPECPTGFTFNPATDQCEASSDPTCDPGTFNPATDQCIVGTEPTCDPGTFNPATDRCEANVAPTCTVGTLNPATDRCEASVVPSCTVGTFNPATDRCEANVAPTCVGSYRYDPNKNRCEVQVGIFENCPPGAPGATVTRVGNTCSYTQNICPSGTTLNSATDRCEANVAPTCTVGTLN